MVGPVVAKRLWPPSILCQKSTWNRSKGAVKKQVALPSFTDYTPPSDPCIQVLTHTCFCHSFSSIHQFMPFPGTPPVSSLPSSSGSPLLLLR